MTVVLCGSLGATSSIFDAQAPVLEDVVRVEHPGHDGAPPAEVRTVADLAARVTEDRFSFVGVSLGGAVGLEAIVDAVLARWFTGDVPDGFREMFLSTDRESYAQCCEALAQWDVREELGAIDVPTLVIAGEQDPSTPPEHGELIAARIPGARLEVIPNAAHLANVERSDEFNLLLEEFL
jgi:pimeloyl-ACP methyl ester carboxylesterase